MFSLTLQMVQNIVEADSPQSELLSWGQELWSAGCTTQGSSFTVRNHCKNLSVQSCVLGGAAEVGAGGISGAEGAGAALLCRQDCSHISLPWLPSPGVPLQLLKLNFRPDTPTGLFLWTPLKCLQPEELTEKSTPGVFKVLLMETNIFPRKGLHSVVVFILLKSKLNFQPSLKDELCIFCSEITFCFAFGF